MLTLALYGLAAMHCTLEGVPGFDFLKTCCFVEAETTAPPDCESDGCGAVEEGSYRPEEQSAFAPQPLLFLVWLSPVSEAPLPRPQIGAAVVASESPPARCRPWQFVHRTARPPRAPSIAS